jgi:hypothetical protein
MAKRSDDKKPDKSGIILVDKQVKPKEVSVKREPELVTIRLLYPVTYNYESLSGSIIVWNGAGSQNNVSREDANVLLTKTRKGGCCGSISRIVHIFEEVNS